MSDYLKLPKIIKVRGIGIPSLTMSLIKEDGAVKMYLRDDDIYEVGIVPIVPAAEIFGKQYPKREQIWSNEDFGTSVSSSRHLEHAEELFKMYQKRMEKHEQVSNTKESSEEQVN